VALSWPSVLKSVRSGYDYGMPNTYTAITQQADGWWVGWIEEVPGVNCQARTRDELLASLRETLAEALEMNREAARSAAVDGYTEEPIAV